MNWSKMIKVILMIGAGITKVKTNAINNALMIDFASQNGPKIGPKLLPNWFQRALEGALNEDSDSKLKK